MTRHPSATVILVRLGLALSSLRFGVGRHGRVRLLDGHGATEVRALAQEVRFGGQTEGALSQHHAHRGALLGSGSVAELQGGEVHRVAFAQKLWDYRDQMRSHVNL